MQNKRESGLELLRIFGIISMHIFGDFIEICTGINMLYGCVINSVFNMGVSVFALIAGYFGNSGASNKIIRQWLTVIQYSLLIMVISILCHGIDLGNINDIQKVVSGLFPVFTRKYWFFSCYMVLMLLAGPINLFINAMEEKQYRNFLFMSLFIFSFMPTILMGTSITMDKGKGLVNFLLMFFVGRYIGKYSPDIRKRRWSRGGVGRSNRK